MTQSQIAYAKGVPGANIFPPPQVLSAVPPSTNTNFQIGQKIYIRVTPTSANEYTYVGGGTWEPTGGGSIVIDTINSNSPINGNYNLAGTTNQINKADTAGTTTFSLPTTLVAPGSITATTTLTATLGNITATNGNIVRGAAGNKDVYSSVASTTTAGANSAGTVTLVGGTATVSTTAVTASSIIRIYRQGIGSTGAAALGILSIGTITAGTSFVINAVQAANATALQASDVSVIGWEIVN